MDACQCRTAQLSLVHREGLENHWKRHDGQWYDASRSHLPLPSEQADPPLRFGSARAVKNKDTGHRKCVPAVTADRAEAPLSEPDEQRFMRSLEEALQLDPVQRDRLRL